MPRKEFRKLVKARMREKGLSMRGLAEKADVSVSLLTRAFSGERSIPSDEILRKIARALDMDASRLRAEAGRAEPRMVPLLRAAGRLSKKELEQVIKTAEKLASDQGSPRRKKKRG